MATAPNAVPVADTRPAPRVDTPASTRVSTSHENSGWDPITKRNPVSGIQKKRAGSGCRTRGAACRRGSARGSRTMPATAFAAHRTAIASATPCQPMCAAAGGPARATTVAPSGMPAVFRATAAPACSRRDTAVTATLVPALARA